MENLRNGWHIATTYGGCFDPDAEVVGLVTEYFEHYTLVELLSQTVPWCVRAKIAIGFVDLVQHLDNSLAGPGVLCDWSLENFDVRKKDYRVVLHNLQSYHTLGVRKDGSTIALHSDKHCGGNTRPKAFCHTLEPQCSLGWHGELDSPTPDGRCNVKTKRW